MPKIVGEPELFQSKLLMVEMVDHTEHNLNLIDADYFFVE